MRAEQGRTQYWWRCTRRNSSVAAATIGKEVLTRLLIGGSDVVVDRLTGLLGHLEPDRLAGLFLAHRRAIDGTSMRRHIFHLQADDDAASQHAIDQTPSGDFDTVSLPSIQGSRREA